MFNEGSVVVKVWVKAVLNGEKALSEVPNLSNLIEIVTSIIEGGKQYV